MFKMKSFNQLPPIEEERQEKGDIKIVKLISYYPERMIVLHDFYEF